MNPLTKYLDLKANEEPIQLDLENEVLEYIFDNSMHQDSDRYCKLNICQHDAEDLAIQSDNFIYDWINARSDFPFETFDSVIEEYPDKYAYHLAYDNPLLATQLLDEMLYYRSKGRI